LPVTKLKASHRGHQETREHREIVFKIECGKTLPPAT
jgi:hypothetical protein